MYYIYHIPGKKIGCTSDLEKRMSDQGFTEWEILETYEDGWVAGDRERELQKEYGYPVDAQHYMSVIENRKKGSIKGGINRSKKDHGTFGGYVSAQGASNGGKKVSSIERTCPHCSITIKGPVYFVHHGNNCKLNKEQ